MQDVGKIKKGRLRPGGEGVQVAISDGTLGSPLDSPDKVKLADTVCGSAEGLPPVSKNLDQAQGPSHDLQKLGVIHGDSGPPHRSRIVQ